MTEKHQNTNEGRQTTRHHVKTTLYFKYLTHSIYELGLFNYWTQGVLKNQEGKNEALAYKSRAG